MIGLIQGQVHHLMAPTVVLMTTAGVGYEIEMP
ncbi:MAG TPA: Holliday junction branch migration protein RuvA, partial [Moraxellaceae bacterium]|nr:Holliday junction branch migration protein RuvA [Moraxellaceae bacterium]